MNSTNICCSCSTLYHVSYKPKSHMASSTPGHPVRSSFTSFISVVMTTTLTKNNIKEGKGLFSLHFQVTVVNHSRETKVETQAAQLVMLQSRVKTSGWILACCCFFFPSPVLHSSRPLNRKWCRPQWARSSHNQQSRQLLTDFPGGKPDVESFSLRLCSQRF